MPANLYIFLAVLAVIAVCLYLAYLANEKRKRELAEFAERVGLFFAPDGNDAHERYDSFTPFGRGSSRRSANLLHGQRGEASWEIFDYRYTTGSGKNKRTYRFGVAAATVPVRSRNMTLRPEGLFDKVAAMVGVDDINFESEEFSRRYHVSCDERKFAYDVIHPQMIEYLMTCPPRHWQLGGHVVLIHKSGSFDLGEIEELMAMVDGFVERIPAYVREDASRHAAPGAT